MRKMDVKKVRQALKKSSQVSREKLAQQEMVGFVLIVVVIVIALMVFLVISVRKPSQTTESSDVENMLASIMSYTTECAINSEPDFDDVGALIKSCYGGRRCSNLEIDSCDYLEKKLANILEELFKSESVYSGYTFNAVVADERKKIFEKIEGTCLGASKTGSSKISIDSKTSIDIFLKLCSPDSNVEEK